jgi:hypothetical protein
MPRYISNFPDKHVQWDRFFESRFVVDSILAHHGFATSSKVSDLVSWRPRIALLRLKAMESDRESQALAELGTRAGIGCHTFRATGITAYLEAGGTLEKGRG